MAHQDRRGSRLAGRLERGLRLGLLSLLLASVFILGPARATEADGGPKELLITYRSAPADRPAFATICWARGSIGWRN
jgi:hypothetical protein